MILTTLYIIGITAEAMTGALSAGRRNMDWFGVMLVSSATAIGGGTARDILLGHYPLGWVKHPEYLLITCLAGILTTVIYPWVLKCKSMFLRLDALGLSVFSIIGTQVAMSMGYSTMICLVAALITGVFGGLLRDLICRQKPLVLHEECYATVSLFASGLFLGLKQLGVSEIITIIITVGLSYGFRILAIHYQWHLPSFHLESES
ncbi:TPA: trimeric intracellular cation channel family protein [Vibrio parahaemolyticus]